ncbi:MAG: hypothetical protein AB2693_27275 [Candidatus Thiodiazotropha sp.]
MKANKRIQETLKTATEDCINNQFKEIETCLSKNNIKKDNYQLAKDLTLEKQNRAVILKPLAFSYTNQRYNLGIVETVAGMA